MTEIPRLAVQGDGVNCRCDAAQRTLQSRRGELSALVAGSCRCVTRPSQKRLGTVEEAYRRSVAQSPTVQGTLGAPPCRLPSLPLGGKPGGHAAVATHPPYSELGIAEHRNRTTSTTAIAAEMR